MDKSVEQIKEDYSDYNIALRENDLETCLFIEAAYNLDGCPPQIVSFALFAASEGEDIDECLDRVICE